MSALVDRWNGIVDFWREEEAPDAYALARMAWGAAVVGNVLNQIFSPGVLRLYATPEHGGTWPFERMAAYSLFQSFDPTPNVIYAMVAVNLIAGVFLTVGFFTRTAALLLMVIHMSLVARLSLYGFGGDSMYRVFSFLMVLAPLGASWSVDACIWGGNTRVPIWPRRLIQAQLMFVYVKTGLVKISSQWTFVGRWSALYYALNDPGFARFSPIWSAWLYPLTQVGTLVAHWWEKLFFLLPWNMYLQRDDVLDGRLKRTLGRYDLRPLFLGLGVILHLGLFLTMHLGMFPWVTLSLYTFFLHPAEARGLLERVLPAKLRGVADPELT